MSTETASIPAGHRTRLFVLVAAILSLAIQWALVTRGTMHTLPAKDNHYAQLADAFSNGQFHFTTPPPPGLLALPDPFDAIANQPFREAGLHDLILRDGRLYLYLGPAPAAIAWLLQTVHLRSDDAMVTAVLASLFTLALSVLMLQFAGRGWIHPLVAAAGVLLGTLCLPATWQLARPASYEAAILGAQAALAMALICRIQAIGSRRTACWLVLASAFAGIAVISRVSLVPALCAVAGLDVLWQLFRPAGATPVSLIPLDGRPGRRPYMNGMAILAPLGVCVLLLLAYNHARFGNIRESGIPWMLASQRGRAGLDTTPFSPRYLVKNIVNYAIAPPAIKDGLELGTGFRAFRKDIYTADRIAGVIWSCPAWLLALVGLWRIRNRFVVLSAMVFIALAVAPWMTFFYGAERYLMDVGLPLTVLAILALGVMCRRTRWVIVTTMLVTWTVGIGILFAAIGYT